jgi:hypothetical protein
VALNTSRRSRSRSTPKRRNQPTTQLCHEPRHSFAASLPGLNLANARTRCTGRRLASQASSAAFSRSEEGPDRASAPPVSVVACAAPVGWMDCGRRVCVVAEGVRCCSERLVSQGDYEPRPGCLTEKAPARRGRLEDVLTLSATEVDGVPTTTCASRTVCRSITARPPRWRPLPRTRPWCAALPRGGVGTHPARSRLLPGAPATKGAGWRSGARGRVTPRPRCVIQGGTSVGSLESQLRRITTSSGTRPCAGPTTSRSSTQALVGLRALHGGYSSRSALPPSCRRGPTQDSGRRGRSNGGIEGW